MVVKFRVTETVAQTFLDGEGALPFDLVGLATPGTAATPRVKRVSAGASAVVPPYNTIPPEISGTADVGQTLSLISDAWNGAGAFDYEWYADGALSATTATLLITSGLRGKTITARKRSQSVNGSEPSEWAASTNALFVPATGGDGVLDPAEYGYSEAVADADTRKTYVVISDTPPVGYDWIIYRGNNSSGDLAFVAVPTFDGTNWVWTSTGTAAVGTGPDGRTQVYVRIGLRETATPANAYFVTPIGVGFLASSIPGAPTATFATGAGQGEIDITITNGADVAGRTLTRYEYQLDTGSWLVLPGDTASGLRTINTGNPTTTYVVKVRAVNVNGNGIATAGVSVASGTTTVVPSQVASDAWSVTDKPSTSGNTVTLAYTGALPANGGSAITDLGYKLNGGSFVSLGLTLPVTVDVTVTATTLATFDVQAQNSVGFSVASTKTVTPTTTAALAATAEFGELTPALAGGWRPTTALGDEIELVSPVVSQTGCTRTWSIVDGALVANGTPDVDNTKTVVVTTVLGGNVSVTIATTATAWSVRTPTELSAALAYNTSAALTIFMRPVTFDIQTGTATVALSGVPQVVGRFYNRNYSAAPSHRKVTKHPSQVNRWRATKTSYVNSVRKLWLDEVDFWCDAGQVTHLIHQSNPLDGLKITNFSCKAPDIDPAVLTDTVDWPTGPSTAIPLTKGFDFSNVNSTNVWLENGVFKNMFWGLNVSTRGNLVLKNLEFDTYWFDAMRLVAQGDRAAKIITGIKFRNAFGRNNEVFPTTNQKEPHTDSIQLVSGELINCVFSEIELYVGDYRTDYVSMIQANGGLTSCTMFNIIANLGVWAGINSDNSRDVVIGNSVFHFREISDNAYIRLGGPAGHASWSAAGETLIYNTAAVAAFGSALQANQNSQTADYVTTTKSNCVDADSISDLVPYFNNVYLHPTSFAELRTKYTSKPSQTVGPLDEAGAWRTTVYPPLPGNKPTLANAGADLLITPGVSLMYAVLPTTWDYKYRNADGVNNWTKVEGLSGANATLVAPTKTAIQVKARWKNAAGIPGPWSETQTVIV